MKKNKNKNVCVVKAVRSFFLKGLNCKRWFNKKYIYINTLKDNRQ